MVTVKIMGGLGNQMFCFSIGYVIAKELNQPLTIDITDYYLGYFRKYVLDVFKIPDCVRIWHSIDMPIYAERVNLPDNILKIYDTIIDIDTVNSKEEIFKIAQDGHNVYLCGYGGAHLLDVNDIDELRSVFTPRYSNYYYDSLLKRVRNENSVAVHIRRTDFIDLNWNSDNSLSFYLAAMNYLRLSVDSPHFYMFSDDVEWVKDKFGNEDDVTCINSPIGETQAVYDMLSMAECRYHIVTRKSTFSRWACLLSNYRDNYVICEYSDEGNSEKEFNHLNMLFFEKTDIEEYSNLKRESVSGIALQNDCVSDKEYEKNQEVFDINPIKMDNLLFKYNMGNHPEWILNRAIAYMQMENDELALDYFRSIRDTMHSDEKFYHYYAMCLEKNSQHIEALCYATVGAVCFGYSYVTSMVVKPQNDVENDFVNALFKAREISDKNNLKLVFLTKYSYKSINKYIVTVSDMLYSLGFRTVVVRSECETFENANVQDHVIYITSLLELSKNCLKRPLITFIPNCNSDVDRYFGVRYSESEKQEMRELSDVFIDISDYDVFSQKRNWSEICYSELPVLAWDNRVNDDEVFAGIAGVLDAMIKLAECNHYI